MEFTKQVLVLKQISEGYSVNGKNFSGIARIEIESGVGTLYLSLINLAGVTEGSYTMTVIDCKNKVYNFDVGKNPFSTTLVFEETPDVSGGLSCGLIHFNDDTPILVGYASSSGISLDVWKFKTLVSEFFKKKKVKLQTLVAQPLERYEDETVATENYFLYEDGERESAARISAAADGDCTAEKITCGCGCEGETDGNKPEERFADCNVNCADGETESVKAGESAGGFGVKDSGNEEKTAPDGTSGAEIKDEVPYCERIRAEIEELFGRYPEEESLTGCIPHSKWAKINYTETKYYTVGIIYEDGDAKYICYGIPARYSVTPPKELQGYCSFLPISLFDLKGDGYWMLYQDAKTGKCVKLSGY